MTGDPLDRIAAELSPGTGAGPDVTMDRAVAMALVEVARADRELNAAITPLLPTMNYYFGPGARTAVSHERVQSYRRIHDAVKASAAALARLSD